ncbi:MAG: DMT family transporter [Syntrophomonadaceae bacterium]|jgi:transporter family-2 protein
MPNLLYLGLAALSGATMALQGTLNSVLGKLMPIWNSILVVHVVGMLTAVAIVVVTGGFNMSGWSSLGKIPWYAYLGGVLNVVIIYAVSTTMPKIGVGNATTAIIVAQVLTAVLIDCLGAFGMKKYHFQYIDLVGIALLAIGARILLLK